MCGVGGLGKTQVAVEYALQYRDHYTAVLMVNADTPESLRSGIAGLAGVLYADLDPATTDDIKERATLDWLQKHPGWLLIVDNADTETARDAVIARLTQWANGHVLITARLKQWPQTVEALDLHVLGVDDGARFLLKATEGRRRAASDEEAQARLLAGDDLDGLCLALEQAAAYIAERQISFEEYRQRWAENAKQARTWADGKLMQYHPESEVSLSIATTWLTTFQQLPPASRRLLEMLSWLAPAPIPQGLMDHPELERQLQLVSGPALAAGSSDERGGEPAASAVPLTEVDIETALIPLRRYSLLAHRPGDPVDSAGRVHRVMQLITRERLSSEQQKSAFAAMLEALHDYTPIGTHNVTTWSVLQPLLPHLLAVIEHAKPYDHPEPTTALMGAVASYYGAIAKHASAEKFERQAMELDELRHGPSSPKYATRLSNFAGTLQATNRLEEAEPLMRRALAIDEQFYGPEHSNVANRLNNLAHLLQAMNRLAEAESLLRRAENICSQSSAINHNKGKLLWDTNRLAEAEKCFRRAVELAEEQYGTNHLDVAQHLNCLALLLHATNRSKEAEPMLHRSMWIFEQYLDVNHPDIANLLNSLAVLLLDTNRRSEGEPLMQRAVAITDRYHRETGIEHPCLEHVQFNARKYFYAKIRHYYFVFLVGICLFFIGAFLFRLVSQRY